ncbi:MAG TPA: cytochrome b N-terminal domain-containing protein [Candidatus Nanopelagicaceae bacterium]
MKGKWTTRLRRVAIDNLEFESLLPDEQPVFVASWLYIISVLSIASLIIVFASGAILALRGADWYHSSEIGLFFNSIHFWSTEIFFLFIIVHIWANFWRAAWRGHRFSTWVAGSISFIVTIATAFTGFLVQTNFHSQIMANQAKNSLNAVGIGQIFNTLNTGQMLLLHVSIFPVAVGVAVLVHVMMVRRHGFVPPLDAQELGGAKK